ncbi:MAG: Ig-like domain-containing protein, partial [Gemmatimonadetes bacterium]|nr:Ig-like domain-containing protein [Gemmatimonadota bacterium]
MNRVSHLARRLLWFCPLLVAACDTVAVAPLPVGRVEISPRSVDVAIGGSVQLSASAVGEDGNPLPGVAISWRSSDADVALVDSQGRVTGLEEGLAAITATVAGVTASAAINVRERGQLLLSDSLVTLRADVGGAGPAPATVRINGTGGSLSGLTAQVVYDAGDPIGWLTPSLVSTATPATLELDVDPGALGLGRYGAEVRITSPLATESVAVRVEFSVTTSTPSVRVDPDSVRLTNADRATVDVGNGGGGTLTDLVTTVRYGGGSPGWLRATLSGSTAPVTLTVESLTGSLVAGSYTAEVEIASRVAGVPSAVLAVRLDVGAAPPRLVVAPASVSIQGSVGGTLPLRTVQVTNGGAGTVTGLGKAVSYAPGEPTGWLIATLDRSSTPASLSLLVGTAGLTAGTYSASVEVNGNSVDPVFVPVRLTLDPAAPTAPAAP